MPLSRLNWMIGHMNGLNADNVQFDRQIENHQLAVIRLQIADRAPRADQQQRVALCAVCHLDDDSLDTVVRRLVFAGDSLGALNDEAINVCLWINSVGR
jgi:hypothetical protein